MPTNAQPGSPRRSAPFRILAIALLGVVAASACTDASARIRPKAARTPNPELGNGRAITIAFGGDSSFEGLGGALAARPGDLLAAMAPTLSRADFAMVNLETALGTTGSPSPKAFNFRAPATAITALGAAGVDAVTMANNHGMDYGPTGLTDTLAIRSASAQSDHVSILGVGSDENDAYSPLITEVKGQRLGVIAANDVFDTVLEAQWTAGPAKAGLASAKAGDREARLVRQVRDTRKDVDTLVVYLHMGREKDTCPTPRQVELADALHKAGADIVIGSHAHRLQGAGFRNGRFVAYGMGNFVFKAPTAESAKAAALEVTVTGRRVDSFHWVPASIRNAVPVPLSGNAEAAAQAELEQRRECAGLSPNAGDSELSPNAGPADRDAP